MFGFGPGLLPSDAMMLGIDPETQRDRMADAIDTITRLLAGGIIPHAEYPDIDLLVNAEGYVHKDGTPYS
jgi:hypothetical protein